MTTDVDHDTLDQALKSAGSSWGAAQAHGLLSGKLAVLGRSAGPDWLARVLEDTDLSSTLRKECEDLLDTLLMSTYREFSERLSEFAPLLPNDNDSTVVRTEALAHWSEGYLHGLVSAEHDERLKSRLAAEPVAGIIKDLLAITRAEAEVDGDHAEEEAYTEIVEYLRVAAQLVYEELAEVRPRVQ